MKWLSTRLLLCEARCKDASCLACFSCWHNPTGSINQPLNISCAPALRVSLFSAHLWSHNMTGGMEHKADAALAKNERTDLLPRCLLRDGPWELWHWNQYASQARSLKHRVSFCWINSSSFTQNHVLPLCLRRSGISWEFRINTRFSPEQVPLKLMRTMAHLRLGFVRGLEHIYRRMRKNQIGRRYALHKYQRGNDFLCPGLQTSAGSTESTSCLASPGCMGGIPFYFTEFLSHLFRDFLHPCSGLICTPAVCKTTKNSVCLFFVSGVSFIHIALRACPFIPIGTLCSLLSFAFVSVVLSVEKFDLFTCPVNSGWPHAHSEVPGGKWKIQRLPMNGVVLGPCLICWFGM